MGKTKREIFCRILFVNKSAASKKAIKLFRDNGLSFSQVEPEPDSQEFYPSKLPVLIAGDAVRELNSVGIQRYVKAAVALGEF